MSSSTDRQPEYVENIKERMYNAMIRGDVRIRTDDFLAKVFVHSAIFKVKRVHALGVAIKAAEEAGCQQAILDLKH